MLGVIVLFIIIVLFDLKTVLLKTNKRALTMSIYFVLMIVSLTISIFITSDKAPVSPAVIIESILKGIGIEVAK